MVAALKAIMVIVGLKIVYIQIADVKMNGVLMHVLASTTTLIGWDSFSRALIKNLLTREYQRLCLGHYTAVSRIISFPPF